MSKKAALSLLGLILLSVGLAVGFFLVQRQQTIEQRAAPATTLELKPSTSTPAVDQTFTVDIDINTNENQVIGTELYVNFAKDYLEAVDITPGGFFQNVQTLNKNLDNATGKISYVLFLPTSATAQSGTGTVATITFKAKASGATTISLSDQTLVGAIGEDVGQNVLTSTIPASINIGGQSQPTATPTTAPTLPPGTTATPTQIPPTPTATPTNPPGTTATPTLIPTATPTTPIGGSNPTATPTIRPTSVPTGNSDNLPQAGVPLPTIVLTLAGLALIVSGASLLGLKR